MSRAWPSVGRTAAPLVRSLIDSADILRLAATTTASGATIVDAGISAIGGIEAGLRIAEICLGGLGRVTLHPSSRFPRWRTSLMVSTTDPVLSCLASQYAGWSLQDGDFFALGSGPGRAAGSREPLFNELGYRDRTDEACLVLETDKVPPDALVEQVAADCGVSPERLTLILTPTQSLAGNAQVVARVLEVALHKAHALEFPLDRIVEGVGTAPLPPPGADFITAMGRTNDATLYGGEAHLVVTGPEDEAISLAKRLPSAASRDHGRTFAEIFQSYNGDFYAMDPMLFSPAVVTVTALETGRSFTSGRVEETLIDRSFSGRDD